MKTTVVILGASSGTEFVISWLTRSDDLVASPDADLLFKDLEPSNIFKVTNL